MNSAFLLGADLRSAARWFLREPVAKLLVILAFLGLFTGLAFFIYSYSRIFFTNLGFYEAYGDFFASYVLHAAVVVLLWFGLISALVETLLVISSRSNRFAFLATLPVSGFNLTAWLQAKSLSLNLFLVSVILIPAGLAYQTVGINHSWTLVLAVVLLTLFTLGLGTALGYAWMLFFRNKARLGLLLTAVVVAVGSYLLLELIFPQNLIRLYFAPAENFFTLASTLPLANFSLYSFWLVELINGKLEHLTSLVTLVAVVWLFGFMVMSSFITRAWRLTWSLPNLVKFTSRADWLQAFPAVLAVKDVLTVWRFRRELVYAGFQLSLSVVMFGLLLRSSSLRPLSQLESGQLLGLAYGWLMFFAAAYLLRFVFPLMAREGNARWLVLNLKSQARLVGEKLIGALVFALPVIILDALLWLASPFGQLPLLITFTSVSVILLSLLLALLGSLNPDFGHATDPEKTSTSLWGLIGLALAIGWTWLSGQALLGWLEGNQSLAFISFPLFATFLLLVGFLTVKRNYRE